MSFLDCYVGGEPGEVGDVIECVKKSDYGDVGVVGKQYIVTELTPSGSIRIGKSPGVIARRFKLIRRKEQPKQLVRCNQSDRCGTLEVGCYYTIIARDPALGVVKIAENQNTWFSEHCFGGAVATDQCPELPVEDVEDLRAEMLRLKSELFSKTWNYNNAMDANRALRQQVKDMKDRFERIRTEAQIG